MDKINIGTVWTVGELKNAIAPFTDDLRLERGTTLYFGGQFPDYRIKIDSHPLNSLTKDKT